MKLLAMLLWPAELSPAVWEEKDLEWIKKEGSFAGWTSDLDALRLEDISENIVLFLLNNDISLLSIDGFSLLSSCLIFGGFRGFGISCYSYRVQNWWFKGEPGGSVRYADVDSVSTSCFGLMWNQDFVTKFLLNFLIIYFYLNGYF